MNNCFTKQQWESLNMLFNRSSSALLSAPPSSLQLCTQAPSEPPHSQSTAGPVPARSPSSPSGKTWKKRNKSRSTILCTIFGRSGTRSLELQKKCLQAWMCLQAGCHIFGSTLYDLLHLVWAAYVFLEMRTWMHNIPPYPIPMQTRSHHEFYRIGPKPCSSTPPFPCGSISPRFDDFALSDSCRFSTSSTFHMPITITHSWPFLISTIPRGQLFPIRCTGATVHNRVCGYCRSHRCAESWLLEEKSWGSAASPQLLLLTTTNTSLGSIHCASNEHRKRAYSFLSIPGAAWWASANGRWDAGEDSASWLSWPFNFQLPTFIARLLSITCLIGHCSSLAMPIWSTYAVIYKYLTSSLSHASLSPNPDFRRRKLGMKVPKQPSVAHSILGLSTFLLSHGIQIWNA